MKEKLMRGSHALGLAARIIFSVVIIAVIIWKYDYFKELDIRGLISESANPELVEAQILRRRSERCWAFICSNPSFSLSPHR